MTKHERNLTGEPRDLPRLCNVMTVARELDCGRSKVYAMISAGTLPSVLIDGMVRVPREGLEDYIKQCANNSGSASTGGNSSPSEDTERASNAARSALKRDRIARRRPN